LNDSEPQGTDSLNTIFELFQRPAQLVGAGCWFCATADAVQSLNDVVYFLAFYQSADALQVPVAAAIKLNILYDIVVVCRHFY
jgi:hypothetical protein